MASGATVLVIEHDEPLQRLLRQTLRTRYTVLTASCWAQALEISAQADVDVVVADVTLTAREGTALNSLCAEAGKVPFVLLASANWDPEAAHASDVRPPLLAFPGRPVQLGELPRTLEDAIADNRVCRDAAQSVSDDDTGILAESRAMRTVMALIDRAAVRDTPVLLIGESGTGKELLARALHRKSLRAVGPFVAVNCSAIPETLLESELFGHRRGAFTDARDDQRGLFRAAHGGAIFLDEIGDMAPALQGKLLRVLQEKEVQPLGASVPVPVDGRIITATHHDLGVLVAEGRFRQDLLYRINVIEVRVPPLRERPDDLVPLVRYLLDKHGAKLGKPGCRVGAAAMGLLRRHTWPGNVRELENVIERALVLGTGKVINVDDLPDSVRYGQPSSSGGSAGRRLSDVEREHIVRTLRTVAGNKAAAARVLGLNRKTLYRKLTQHRIAAR
jgi:two-component system, NtrC family, response regulator HydG